MCSGAMLLARIPEVYYGATDPKAGTAGTLMNLLEDERFNHVVYVEAGVLEEECRLLLVQFFKRLRAKKKKKLLKIKKRLVKRIKIRYTRFCRKAGTMAG